MCRYLNISLKFVWEEWEEWEFSAKAHWARNSNSDWVRELLQTMSGMFKRLVRLMRHCWPWFLNVWDAYMSTCIVKCIYICFTLVSAAYIIDLIFMSYMNSECFLVVISKCWICKITMLEKLPKVTGQETSLFICTTAVLLVCNNNTETPSSISRGAHCFLSASAFIFST